MNDTIVRFTSNDLDLLFKVKHSKLYYLGNSDG